MQEGRGLPLLQGRQLIDPVSFEIGLQTEPEGRLACSEVVKAHFPPFIPAKRRTRQPRTADIPGHVVGFFFFFFSKIPL